MIGGRMFGMHDMGSTLNSIMQIDRHVEPSHIYYLFYFFKSSKWRIYHSVHFHLNSRSSRPESPSLANLNLLFSVLLKPNLGAKEMDQ